MTPFDTLAQFYDADYHAINYTSDIQFYVDMAVESGGPVLEMGCGTGRILLPTARAGVEIEGSDLSRGMLDALRGKLEQEPPEVRRRVRLTEGDCRSLDLGRRFALVTAPFRVAQILLGRDDQRAWLGNVRRHLRPGGVLCFDVFQPNFAFLANPGGPNLDLDRTDPATGRRTRRYSRIWPHNPLQTMDVEMHWVVEDAAGGAVADLTERFPMRWYTRAELENLLELEGFRVLDCWGSFQREPFGEDSKEQVFRVSL
jgi:SAM-dependent methyltransferase